MEPAAAGSAAVLHTLEVGLNFHEFDFCKDLLKPRSLLP